MLGVALRRRAQHRPRLARLDTALIRRIIPRCRRRGCDAGLDATAAARSRCLLAMLTTTTTTTTMVMPEMLLCVGRDPRSRVYRQHHRRQLRPAGRP